MDGDVFHRGGVGILKCLPHFLLSLAELLDAVRGDFQLVDAVGVLDHVLLVWVLTEVGLMAVRADEMDHFLELGGVEW